MGTQFAHHGTCCEVGQRGVWQEVGDSGTVPLQHRAVALDDAGDIRLQPAMDTRQLAQAAAAGATIVRPAGRAFWGGTTGVFKDPDGHLWEVAYNPQLLPGD